MTPEEHAQAAERLARVLRTIPPEAHVVSATTADPDGRARILVLDLPKPGAMLDRASFGYVVEGVRVFRCATAREQAAWVLAEAP